MTKSSELTDVLFNGQASRPYNNIFRAFIRHYTEHMFSYKLKILHSYFVYFLISAASIVVIIFFHKNA